MELSRRQKITREAMKRFPLKLYEGETFHKMYCKEVPPLSKDFPGKEEWEKKIVDSRLQYPLLNLKQEQHLFQQLNYYKYLANQLFAKIEPTTDSKTYGSLARGVFQWEKKSQEIRNLLVRANYGLAYTVVGKYSRKLRGGTFDDVVNEASFVIMRAADGFDWRRGIKFSTYCTTGLFRYMWSHFRDCHKTLDVKQLTCEEKIVAPENSLNDDYLEVQNLLLHELEREYGPRYVDVVKMKHGIGRKDPLMLKDIARHQKVSKQCISQIYVNAIKYMATIAQQKYPELTKTVA